MDVFSRSAVTQVGGFGTSRTRNEILFADYSVTVPSAPVVVSVEDNGILEFQLWLSR
ncbi:MAG: hypothetical protein ABWZ58_07095 [Acidimicrobiia bacterium]